tara:strand:- start:193 stop:621 length:429 start_codon:yes stop_codon:yes gene_type:complete
MRPPVLETLMLMLILHLPCCYAAMATPGEAGSAMRRRDVLKGATAAAALAQQPSAALARVPALPASAGPTNEVISVVDGIRQKRLGGSGIIVSEVGLGTQAGDATPTSHHPPLTLTLTTDPDPDPNPNLRHAAVGLDRLQRA